MTDDAHPTIYELIGTPTTEETGAGRDFYPSETVPRPDRADWEHIARWNKELFVASGLSRPINMELRQSLPTNVVFHSPVPRIYDFQTSYRLPVVSPRFREILENLEPQTHEFIEIDVGLSKFPKLKLPKHFFLNIAKVNDGLDLPNCPKLVAPPIRLPDEIKTKYNISSLQPQEHLYTTPGRGKAFNWVAIRGRYLFAVWNDLCPWAPKFLSQDLMNACARQEILGLAAVRCQPD